MNIASAPSAAANLTQAAQLIRAGAGSVPQWTWRNDAGASTSFMQAVDLMNSASDTLAATDPRAAGTVREQVFEIQNAENLALNARTDPAGMAGRGLGYSAGPSAAVVGIWQGVANSLDSLARGV
jgi:hypothetical protein